MEREESSYLNPPSLTALQVREIYGANPESERQERIAGRTCLKSIRRTAKKHGRIEDL
jgi:hypothetical protein